MNHRASHRFWLLSTVFSLSLIFAFTLVVFAQDIPPSTPEPQGMTVVTLEPTLQAQISATHAAEDAILEAEFRSRTIFGFNIAYLIDQKAEGVAEIVSAPTLSEYFGSVAFSSWDDFVRANTESPFQMVFVHASMLETVDPAWFYDAYRSGIYIIGINVRERQLAKLVGDKCRTSQGDLLDYFENTYIYLEYSALLEKPEHRERVDKAFLEDCTRLDTFTEDMGSVYMATGSSRNTIDDVTNLETLTTMLVSYSVSHNIAPARLLPLPEEPNTAMDEE